MSIVDDIRVRVFCQSAIPDCTGPHAVGTSRLTVHTPAGEQASHAIVVQLWYPVAGIGATVHARGLSWLARLLHPTWAPAHHGLPPASAKDAFPFITYVSDAHGRHDDNTFTLANLASHGFVLAAIDDPYRNGREHVDTALLQASGITPDHYDRRVARGAQMASALLDGLEALKPDGPGGIWAGRLNLKQVGILGYAMGGAVAAETAHTDRRYSVVANLDGALTAQVREVPGPYLMMLSDFSMPDTERGPPQTTTVPNEPPTRLRDFRRAQRQAALHESHVMKVAGTQREHFSDKLIFPSWLARGYAQLPSYKRIRAIIDAYTVAFFTTYLRTDPHPLMCVRHSPYPEVHFIAGSDEHGAWALQEPAGRA